VTVLDATNNWWGSANGPTHAGNTFQALGSGPIAQGDAVTNNVDYVPWLDAAYPGGASFAPVTSEDGDFSSIQAAIDATTKTTINCAAGTYDETLRFDATKAAGISIIGEDKTTTFVTGGIRFEGDYDGLTIQNFTITGDGRQRPGNAQATVGTSASANLVSNAEFSNCIFDGEGADDGGIGGGRFGLYIQKIGGSFTFNNNEVKNYRGGGTIDLNETYNTVTSYTFTNNSIHDNHGSSALRGNPADRTNTVTVTSNTFNNNGNPAKDSWAALEVNEADSVTVSNNTITNTQSGSWAEGEALQFWHITPTSLNVTGNTITNNYQGIYFPGDAWASDLSGVHINFNNIYGNTQFGVKAEAGNSGTADAENNWWGTKDGAEIATMVSDNVDYDPWIGAPVENSKTETVTDGTVDATTEADTKVVVTGIATVTVAEYSSNPGSGFGGDTGKYVDVHIDNPAGVTQIEIRLYYTNADIGVLVESSLRLLWWNGTAWVPCSDRGVDTTDIPGPPAYSGYMWAKIRNDTTPTLADLTGTPFGGGGGVGGGVGGPPPPDTTAPQISNMLVEGVTEITADIRWVTNEPSTSQVEYWASPGTLSPLDSTLVTEHLVHLSGLTPGTTYHYKTMSRDKAGNLAVSDEFTFTTMEKPPAAFSVSNLSIQPLEVQPQEAVNITLSVANTGGTEGSYSAVLKINGIKEAEKSVTVAAGKSQSVSFSVTREEAGSYSVDVSGLTGSFKVVAPAPPPPAAPEAKPLFSWALVGIIAGVIILGVLVFAIARRRAH